MGNQTKSVVSLKWATCKCAFNLLPTSSCHKEGFFSINYKLPCTVVVSVLRIAYTVFHIWFFRFTQTRFLRDGVWLAKFAFRIRKPWDWFQCAERRKWKGWNWILMLPHTFTAYSHTEEHFHAYIDWGK